MYAALACLAQTDLKRLIAYSSVGHMGFVVLAVATFTVGGVQAAVYASVAHGLITGLLFFLAGAIKDRYGTGDLARLTVLYGKVPRLAGLFAFAAMASLGLPGLAGFWGEMLAIRSAVYPDDALPGPTYVVLAVIAALGVILTSAYFLALVRGLLQGAPSPYARSTRASRRSSWRPPRSTPVRRWPVRCAPTSTPWSGLTWSPLVVLTVVLGRRARAAARPGRRRPPARSSGACRERPRRTSTGRPSRRRWCSRSPRSWCCSSTRSPGHHAAAGAALVPATLTVLGRGGRAVARGAAVGRPPRDVLRRRPLGETARPARSSSTGSRWCSGRSCCSAPRWWR